MIWKHRVSRRQPVQGHVPYHGRENALQYRTQDVKNITQKPYYDELYRKAVGVALLELLDDLR